MTANQQAARRYMTAYDAGDRVGVLDTLADDVEWVVPGAFHLQGKAAFEREMLNPMAVFPPKIAVSRVFGEGVVVAVEGTVRAGKADGGEMHLAFCDVFEFRDGLVAKLTAYLMPAGGG